MRLLILAIFGVALTACGTPDRRSDAEILDDVAVDKSTILAQYRCFHSISPRGATRAAWEQEMCIRTKDRLIFARFDSKSGRYVTGATLPFSSVRSVGLFSRGLGRQIHLKAIARISKQGREVVERW